MRPVKLPLHTARSPLNLTAGAFRYASPSFLAKRHVSGDMGNPKSTSSEQSDVKTSRATDGPSEATPSTAEPVSNESKIPGEQDEGTPSHDEVKRDPNEPGEKKRAHVESQGKKPMGPEDYQK